MQNNEISHYEELCPYWEFKQTKLVTEALQIDVTGGEQDCRMASWRDMFDRRIVDIVQPDVRY